MPSHSLSPTVVDCGSPASPANGTIQQLTGTRYGHTVSYTCNIGYSLVGAATRVCQDDGQWSEDVPMCKSELQTTLSCVARYRHAQLSLGLTS